jgi:hypothetical protein
VRGPTSKHTQRTAWAALALGLLAVSASLANASTTRSLASTTSPPLGQPAPARLVGLWEAHFTARDEQTGGTWHLRIGPGHRLKIWNRADPMDNSPSFKAGPVSFRGNRMVFAKTTAQGICTVGATYAWTLSNDLLRFRLIGTDGCQPRVITFTHTPGAARPEETSNPKEGRNEEADRNDVTGLHTRRRWRCRVGDSGGNDADQSRSLPHAGRELPRTRRDGWLAGRKEHGAARRRLPRGRLHAVTPATRGPRGNEAEGARLLRPGAAAFPPLSPQKKRRAPPDGVASDSRPARVAGEVNLRPDFDALVHKSPMNPPPAGSQRSADDLLQKSVNSAEGDERLAVGRWPHRDPL